MASEIHVTFWDVDIGKLVGLFLGVQQAEAILTLKLNGRVELGRKR